MCVHQLGHAISLLRTYKEPGSEASYKCGMVDAVRVCSSIHKEEFKTEDIILRSHFALLHMHCLECRCHLNLSST